MSDAREAALDASWRTNAQAWTRAVREQRIASRRAGTDAAIVAAVLGLKPMRVLDAGCGEGWLARALAAHGIDVAGIDASPELIASANAAGGARFLVAGYADLAAHAHALDGFDVVVCNFALFAEDLNATLLALRDRLADGGRLLVQTVHPWVACGDAPYRDGWRTETFAGFGDEFSAQMPWYFRTLASWFGVLVAAGFAIERCEEPVDPTSGRPLSLMIQARAESAQMPPR